MDGSFLADTFTPLEDAATIARYLLAAPDAPDSFAAARDARIVYLLQQPALMLRGEPADAYIAALPVQGAHRLLWQFLVAATFGVQPLEPPDFLVYIDQVAWSTRGRNPELGASGFPIRREHLIFHELCHLRQLTTADGEPKFHRDDGRAMLALSRHTYEAFDTELLRYGPITLELEQLGTDFVAGAKNETARRKRGQLRVA